MADAVSNAALRPRAVQLKLGRCCSYWYRIHLGHRRIHRSQAETSPSIPTQAEAQDCSPDEASEGSFGLGTVNSPVTEVARHPGAC
jgi:hypothetical protein